MDLNNCRFFTIRIEPKRSTVELDYLLNNALTVASELGRVILTKMWVYDEALYVTFLVCQEKR